MTPSHKKGAGLLASKPVAGACLACGEPKVEHTAVELAHGCKRTPSDVRQRSASRRAA